MNKRLLLRLQIHGHIDLKAEIKSLMWWRCKRPALYQVSSLLRAVGCRHGGCCRYLRGYDPAILCLLLDAYELRHEEPSRRLYHERSVLRRCFHCATEIEFSIEVSRGGTCYFRITCWKDLGSGTISTEDTWSSHCQAFPPLYKPESNNQQSIQEAFELTEMVLPLEPTLHLEINPLPPHGCVLTDLIGPSEMHQRLARIQHLLRAAG